MTDINTREAIFRTAIAEMIRAAARDERFLGFLRDDPGPALAMLAAIIEPTNEPA